MDCYPSMKYLTWAERHENGNLKLREFVVEDATITFDYDKEGRLKKETHKYNSGGSISKSYFEHGNPKKVIENPTHWTNYSMIEKTTYHEGGRPNIISYTRCNK